MQLLLSLLRELPSENAELVWARLDERQRNEVVLALARLIVSAYAGAQADTLLEGQEHPHE